mmetsp:Transcript_32020/g.96380  ORF Transcript_32020/g.96380 Transcript_32020/m.96380 type:complete len:391 (+) Transcript_32020:356-1528(+)
MILDAWAPTAVQRLKLPDAGRTRPRLRRCGPCKRYTPMLAEAYKKLREGGKKFEVVFISSDQDEASFNAYFEKHPWVAKPFGGDKALSKMFNVKGIPTLVILDKDGGVINANARGDIEDIEAFPWKPPTLSELLSGPFVKGDGSEVAGAALANSHIAVYFSAHWCPPCRGFTPVLADVYKKCQAKDGIDFEVLFVSADKDEDAFKSYLGEMPWQAVPYKSKATKGLQAHFEVRGYPTVVMLGPSDADGNREIVNGDARGAITDDADNFPWAPPLVSTLEAFGPRLEESATMVVLAEDSDEATVDEIRANLTEVATKKKAAGSAIAFTIAEPGDRIAPQLRAMMGLDGVAVIVLDIPDSGAYYVNPEAATSVEGLTAFADVYKATDRRQLG